MSLTESLLPGDHADEKKPVGKNFSMHYDTTAQIPPESREPAIRAIAARARDAEDARMLLEACGLIEPCDGGWKLAGEKADRAVVDIPLTDTAREAL